MYASMNLCCICLSHDVDKDHVFLESEISDMVQKLQKMIPQTKFQLEDRQYLCQTCLTSATELHSFLSQFFETNFRICHTLKVRPNLKLDIRTLKPNLKGSKHEALCRICLSSVATPEVCLYESQRNVLHYEWYFVMLSYCDINPELLDLTNDPIMCNSCWQHLMTYYSFKKLYFDFHGDIIHFSQELRKRDIDASDKKVLLQKFRQLSKKYQVEHTNQSNISHFSKRKTLELLYLYILTTENETNFIPGFWKKTLSVWNELNTQDPITKEELITFVTMFFKGSLISNEEYDLVKNHMISVLGRRKHSIAMSEYNNSDLPQTSSNFSINGSYDYDDDDDTCPDITSDMNPSFEIKSEVQDNHVSVDTCPELEVQTVCSEISSKTVMELKTFQESINGKSYAFKCQRCTYKTKHKLAAMKHSLLHNKEASRRSLRLKDKRHSFTETESSTVNRKNVKKRIINPKSRDTSKQLPIGIKELEVSLQRINPAILKFRKWDV